MKNSLSFTQLLRSFSRKKGIIAGITTAALTAVFCCVTIYYYLTTPPDTIIVTTTDFPAGLPNGFTPNDLTNHIETRLKKMIEVADSGDVNNIARQEGFGPRAVKETTIPIRALSDSPSPLYKLKWKGVDLNFCRSLGMGLRAKSFLELGIIGVPQGGGWRLSASLKEGPDYSARSVVTAPRAGGACSDFEKCADDLTEQILQSLDYHRLLSFYIKKNTKDANQRILELYQTTIPPESLQADDLVAWGNAFYGLGQFDEALEKYQEALKKDGNFCSAHAARGFIYYRRPHGDLNGSKTNSLADLRRAEQDFRTGIDCDQKNYFTRTSLCNTLLQEWGNSTNRDGQLLVEAKEQCEKALEINPGFEIASINRGYVLYRQGRHKDALQNFEDLSQIHPTNSALFLNYGFLLYLEYLDSKSEESLRQATAKMLQSWNLSKNSDSGAADNLGYFYYEQGDYAQAVDFWEKANALNAGDPDADCIAGLALAAYKLGDESKAVTLLSNAIHLDSNYHDPTYLKLNSSWSERAATDLAKLIALLPVSPGG